MDETTVLTVLAVLTDIRDELRLLRMGVGLRLEDTGPLGMVAGRAEVLRSMGAALSDGTRTLAQARKIADERDATWDELTRIVDQE